MPHSSGWTGHKLLIGRSHCDHPQIPDAIAVIGWIDDQMLVNYFDYRGGVHRIYEVAVEDSQWRFWRNDAGSQESFVAVFSANEGTLTGQGPDEPRRRVGDDLALTYQHRRAG